MCGQTNILGLEINCENTKLTIPNLKLYFFMKLSVDMPIENPRKYEMNTPTSYLHSLNAQVCMSNQTQVR